MTPVVLLVLGCVLVLGACLALTWAVGRWGE